MKKLVYLLILLPLFAFGQEETITLEQTGYFPDTLVTQKANTGTVSVTQDARLKTIIHNYIKANSKRKIKGWRVQIYFNSGANASVKAKTVINKFKTEYPDVPAYLEYEEPFFKVRVGDFLTKLEAAKFKRQLEANGYSKVFLVEEEINIER